MNNDHINYDINCNTNNNNYILAVHGLRGSHETSSKGYPRTYTHEHHLLLLFIKLKTNVAMAACQHQGLVGKGIQGNKTIVDFIACLVLSFIATCLNAARLLFPGCEC